MSGVDRGTPGPGQQGAHRPTSGQGRANAATAVVSARGVDRGRRLIGVAEQLCHLGHRCAGTQGLGGERVTETVRPIGATPARSKQARRTTRATPSPDRRRIGATAVKNADRLGALGRPAHR